MAATVGNDNGRVTMAVLAARLDYLQATVERNHRDMCDEVRNVRAERAKVTDDHEARLRGLEDGQRRGAWFDVGSFATAVGAIITAVVGGGKS